MQSIIDMIQLPFMQHAFLICFIISITCGIMGSLIVVNRIMFISGGIAHAAYGGIGLSLYFGLPYILGTISFSIGIAMLIAFLTIHKKHHTDTIIGVIWAMGMAFGIILVDLTPGYNVDLMSYLFGSVLTVPVHEIKWMTIIMVAVTGCVVYYYHDFVALSFDDEFARVRGVPTSFLYYLLMCMIALCVVMLIRVVGLILVIALLSIPPMIAERFVRSLYQMMIISSILCCIFSFMGIISSTIFNLSTGPTIILIAGVFFMISLLFHS